MKPNLNRLLPAGVVVVVVDVSAAGFVSVLIENGEATGAVDVVDVAPNWNPVLAGFAADVDEDDVDLGMLVEDDTERLAPDAAEAVDRELHKIRG